MEHQILRIETISPAGEVAQGVGLIEDEMVMCGGSWFAGISVEGFDDFTNETIAYAINEGGVLFDTILDLDDQLLLTWRVTAATSEQLFRLRRLEAKAAAGLMLKLKNGECYVVGEDGSISNPKRVLGSMAELRVDFELGVDHGPL